LFSKLRNFSCNTKSIGIPLLNGPTEFGAKSPVPVQFTEDAKRLSIQNDILFCVRGSTTGRMNWANQEYAIGRGIAALRHKVGTEYKHFIKGIIDVNLANLLATATGSTFPNISRSQLDELAINLPPLPEQKSIANILSSFDEKIELLREQNETLETLVQTIFKVWFVDRADKGWKKKRLGEYISVKHGYAFKGKHITLEKNDKILVTPGNFKIGGGFKSSKKKYYHDSEFPESYILKEGEMVVTMTDLSKIGDTLGYPALIPKCNDGVYLHNQRVGKIIIETEISKYFLYFLMKLNNYQRYIVGSSSGTSVKHTSPTSICNYTFFLPEKGLIDKFSHVSSELLEKMSNNIAQIQIQTLTKTRDTLLPKLMSGEVRVNS